MRFPADVHVVTCIPCGWREATQASDAYAERCVYCGRPVEHYDTTVDDRAELEGIELRPKRRRVAAMTGDVTGALKLREREAAAPAPRP